ncbi:MAG: hypothetical protein ACOZNI_33975 [Myxococcota bacterium]
MRALALALLAGCPSGFETGDEKGPDGAETETDADTDADADADADTDTGWPDATGLASVWGEINWYDVVGDYWADEDFGDAWMQVGPPTEVTIADFYAPAIDRCASTFTPPYTGAGDYYEDGAAEASLEGLGGARITLAWDADAGRYLNDALRAAQFEAGSAYDLNSLEIPDVPPFGVTEVARTGEPFEVTSPEIMGELYREIAREQLRFEWTGSGGDHVLLRLALWEPDGTAPIEVVTCAAADDGSLIVPPDIWTAWAADLQLDIFVGRAMVGRGLVPFDNSSTAMVGTYWLYGAMATVE